MRSIDDGNLSRQRKYARNCSVLDSALLSARMLRLSLRARSGSPRFSRSLAPRPHLCAPFLGRRRYERVAARLRRHVLDGEEPRHARRGAVKPGVELGARGLKGADRVELRHREADVVEAVQQAVLAEGVDLERVARATLADDLLRLEVDLDLLQRLRVAQQLHDLLAPQRHRQHAVLHAVGVEDVGERGGDDRADAHPGDRPRRVLSR
mmetsp:Transcript_10245/g.23706  ORF Transcript_10245/g.23706 Transcript_10245/m.23706 type:complete len:209 (+) Transcript_10245:379-1005(+)